MKSGNVYPKGFCNFTTVIASILCGPLTDVIFKQSIAPKIPRHEGIHNNNTNDVDIENSK
jgi:hypothetical protein